MTTLSLAVLLLMVGAGVCLIPMRSAVQAGVSLLSQCLAIATLGPTVFAVLSGGAPVVSEMAWAYPMGVLRVRLDPLGAFFLSWSLPMTLLGTLYAVGYMRAHFDSRRHLGIHFALLNLTSLAFVLVYTADHALVFLLGWEIAALAAWLLVIWDYPNQKVRFAGFNYLVSTHIGLVFLIAAFMMLYTHSASWDIGGFGQWLRHNPGNERNLIYLLLVISFGLKSAFFPFHSWLPRAHAAAPAHVSALMSGVIHKAGLYALVRFVLLIGKPDEWMAWFLIGFSALSAVIGAVYTVGQRDLKRLLGYSSTENVGIAGIGLGVGCLGLSWGNPVLTTLGFAGGLLHILNHAFFKCQLFYAAGAVYQSTHTVDMERLGGLSRLMPWTACSFILGGLAISALPPLNGFTGEFVIYSGLFNAQAMGTGAKAALYATGALLAFVGAVSALSMTRAYGVVFLGAPRDSAVKDVVEVNRWMLVPMGVHGLGVILLGVMPVLGLALVEGPVRLALTSASQGDVTLQALANALTRVGAISALLVLVTAGLIWLRFKTSAAPTARGLTWGCGYKGVSARMQYTGSSFSAEFGARFSAVMVTLRRRKAPKGYFPTDSYLITDCVDAVERRLFSVINRGDTSASELSDRLHEDDPRIAFGAALVAIVLITGLVLLWGGALR